MKCEVCGCVPAKLTFESSDPVEAARMENGFFRKAVKGRWLCKDHKPASAPVSSPPDMKEEG